MSLVVTFSSSRALLPGPEETSCDLNISTICDCGNTDIRHRVGMPSQQREGGKNREEARSSESGCGGCGGAVGLRSGRAKGCDGERGPARPSPDGGPWAPA